MNGCHETFCDTELVVEHLSDRSETVGSARSVGNELLTCISSIVHTANEHGGVVLRGSRHNHIFCTCFNVSLSFFLCEEKTCRFNNVFSTYSTPADFSGILACSNTDSLAVYNEKAFFQVIVYSAVEATVHCVILEHVSHVVNGEKVVDSNYLDVVSLG